MDKRSFVYDLTGHAHPLTGSSVPQQLPNTKSTARGHHLCVPVLGTRYSVLGTVKFLREDPGAGHHSRVWPLADELIIKTSPPILRSR